MEEELKLIKNEIKQVLLEIQEHVLSVQNPFTAGATRGRPDEAPDSAPTAQRAAVDTGAGDPPATRQPAIAAPQPPGVPNGGFPVAPQVLSPAPGYALHQNLQAQAPPPPPPPPPVAQTEPGDSEIERPPDPPRDQAAGSQPDLSAPPASRKKIEIDLETSTPNSRDADDDEGNLDAPSDSWTRDEAGDLVDEPESHEPCASADDSGESANVDKAGKHAGKAVAHHAGAGSVEPQPKTRLDLATLASLVQWTHRVVQDTGADYAATLFEVSEMTGRLSSDLQQVLLALVRLLSPEASGSADSVTKAVTLLAQLDGLMGSTTQEDARLLPFLLRGDLEVLSLIQR